MKRVVQVPASDDSGQIKNGSPDYIPTAAIFSVWDSWRVFDWRAAGLVSVNKRGLTPFIPTAFILYVFYSATSTNSSGFG